MEQYKCDFRDFVKRLRFEITNSIQYGHPVFRFDCKLLCYNCFYKSEKHCYYLRHKDFFVGVFLFVVFCSQYTKEWKCAHTKAVITLSDLLQSFI